MQLSYKQGRRTKFLVWVYVLVASALLHGCGSEPIAKAPPMKETRQQVRIEGGLIVDYAVTVKYSSIDKMSCYAFIAGTVENDTDQRLSRLTAIHFDVFSSEGLLYRDFTQPRTDVAPRSRVQFEMLTSPTFAKRCPAFDRIDVSVKKITLP